MLAKLDEMTKKADDLLRFSKINLESHDGDLITMDRKLSDRYYASDRASVPDDYDIFLERKQDILDFHSEIQEEM